MHLVKAAALAVTLLMSGTAHAAVVWTDFTAASAASGNVRFTGSANGVSTTVSAPDVLGYNIDITDPNGFYTPASSFDALGTRPSEIIQLYGGSATPITVTFSQAVIDPVLAVFSVNQRYEFSSAITLLDQGGGPYGGGTLSVSGTTNNILNGNEGYGLVQLTGSFTSFTFTNPAMEYWSGFTVGIQGVDEQTTDVPEPAAVGLLGLGILGLAASRRRKAA